MGKMDVSRRQFLKLAGLGGAGAAASAVVLRDADGLLASPGAAPASRHWWVRQVDKPTTEVDWDRVARYDERNTCRRSYPKYAGEDLAKELTANQPNLIKESIIQGRPGYTLKDWALYNAQGAGGVSQSFLGPQKAATPADRGVPPWQGSAEENARIVRAALRHFGASTAGFVELDERTRKLIYAVDPDGKPLQFQNVDAPSEDDKTRVIPDRARWVIVYTVQMSEETLKRAPTPLGAQTTTLTYARYRNIQAQLQEFLRGLGYWGLGESSTNALGISPAFGVMAGLGELSRLNRLITPEHGPMVRVFKLVTDLPLATDRPIDAGIMSFCKTCKKCADLCPSGALSKETEPTWQTQGPWNNPGHKAWFEDSVKCRTYWYAGALTNCGTCFSVCPFAKKDKAFVHDWVKAAVGTTPVLNSMFVRMDDAFGYGEQKDPEAWWHTNLPEMGVDSTLTV